MARRCCTLLLLFGMLMLASCQRAQKYAPLAKAPAPDKSEIKDDDADLYLFSWRKPGERHDLPIIFVPDTDPEWPKLKGYWNMLPLPTGMPTAHLGLDPFSALAAFALTEHHSTVKIKVPRGLPDPTEHFPNSNPPTYGKWRIGQKLFHETQLDAEGGPYSCATCHKAEFGFAERHPISLGGRGKFNTLSLVNVAYNRRQFWDGRVESLEETLVRNKFDERVEDPKRSEKALHHHNWGGFVRSLVKFKQYDPEFQAVFGVAHPTQDTVAQALATYLRTILSGDSLYDRARQAQKDMKAEKLTAAHFLELLKDDKTAAALQVDLENKRSPEQLAQSLENGAKLFHGTARCAQCHVGPLFTDGDFHNIGYKGDDAEPAIGTETGRALHVPVGRKESRLVGAFRTPTLRNLAKTGPYMHNGAQYTLGEVVEFYDSKIIWSTHLASTLRDGENPRHLKLQPDDKDALVLFLHALEGTPVDPIVTRPVK